MKKIDFLKRKVKSEVKKLPLCSKLERGIIKRLEQPNFLENQLIRIFLEKDPERLEKIFANYIKLGINYEPIFKKINDNIDAFPIYLAELQAAAFLIEKHKIQNVVFLSESSVGKKPEFQFNYQGNTDSHYCEVKLFQELYPEFGLLRNKLAAKSYSNKKFQANFAIRDVEYKPLNNSEKNFQFVKEEVDDFINKLSNELVSGKNVDMSIITQNNMKITLGIDYSKKEFQFSFGGSAQWISEIVAFELLHKAFSLIIERVYEALQQIKQMKSSDLSKDVIVIYLNIDFRNKFFFDEYIKKAIDHIIEGLQLAKIVTVEIIP